MKSKGSLINRNIIAVTVLVIIAVISGKISFDKQKKFDELELEREAYLKTIESLELELESKKKELDEIDSSEFIEKYAREVLRMVKPNELYFKTYYPEDEEEE